MGRYRPPTKQGSKYITPEGAAELKRELDHLWRVKRPEVTRAVAEAAAQGDRSENAEYIYGKKQLAEIDRRVRFLRKRLDGMRIVAGPPQRTQRIYFGAWFDVRDEGGKTATYRVVGPDESGAAPEYLSMDAPLGRAVMGKLLHDVVEVRTPRGTRELEITAVRYEGIAAKAAPTKERAAPTRRKPVPARKGAPTKRKGRSHKKGPGV
jgi:transcription elongation factor GreB